jgi:hypothetical protein
MTLLNAQVPDEVKLGSSREGADEDLGQISDQSVKYVVGIVLGDFKTKYSKILK